MQTQRSRLETKMLDDLVPLQPYGPFLRFEAYTRAEVDEPASWTGTVLYVCHHTLTMASQPTCVVTDNGHSRSHRATLLDSYKGWNFWRFNLSFNLEENEREILYRMQASGEQYDDWSFFIPGAEQKWRMSAYSCSGFSDGIDQNEWTVDGDHPLVRHLLNKHREQPIHVNFGGGDQLYNDDVFKCASIHDWLQIPDRAKRLSVPFRNELKEQAEDYYFSHYCQHFETKSLREMCATIPNVMLWDDHDIFDGWGSYPSDMLNAPVFAGLFFVARRFYLAFQHHTTIEEFQDGMTDLFGSSPLERPSFSYLKRIGPTVSILGADIRSERTKEQIMSLSSWDRIFDKLDELPPEVEHLIVNFTVPIIYPKVPISEGILEMVSHMTHISALNALLVKTNILSSLVKFEFGEPELLDDLVDHWTGSHHCEERKVIVRRFQQLAVNRKVRITFLSGDVHCAGLGRFYTYPKLANLAEDPLFMPQLITSAIINPPPPPVAIKLMHSFDRAGNRVNNSTREKMVRFFKEKFPREEKVLSRRNFLIVDGQSDGSLKASIYVEEDHKDMLKDPMVFPLHIPGLSPSISGRIQTSETFAQPIPRMATRTLTRTPPVTPRNSPPS